MDKNVLRVGIVGCGKIAQTRHIPEYAANEQATIVGYYDHVGARAEEMSKHYGGRAFASLEELLASDEIDAVSVCSSNATHASITVAALRAGKHVLCEKPMATPPAECEGMLAAAKEWGVEIVELDYIEGNERALRLYEKKGFEIVGKRPNAYKLRDGHTYSEYFMQKRL